MAGGYICVPLMSQQMLQLGYYSTSTTQSDSTATSTVRRLTVQDNRRRRSTMYMYNDM